jgi:phosphoglycerate dehydrogenase-like enzyme
MPRILLIDPIPSPVVERLRPLFPAGASFDVVPTSSEEDLAQYGAEAEVLLVIHRKVDAHLLSLVPRVRLVQRVGVGYDNLDLAALQAAGVVAAYTPGANAVAVAEHTILLMLALLKRFVAAEAGVRQGGWPTLELFQAGLSDLLINTSRGEVLDEAALRRALVNGKLGGAALDVLPDERPGGNPFADLPQVIVTPHMAGGSRAAVERALQMAMVNVGRFLRGEAPLDLVPLPSAS